MYQLYQFYNLHILMSLRNNVDSKPIPLEDNKYVV